MRYRYGEISKAKRVDFVTLDVVDLNQSVITL
jgi:hypothetical protein